MPRLVFYYYNYKSFENNYVIFEAAGQFLW